jgi:hypothetical protein
VKGHFRAVHPKDDFPRAFTRPPEGEAPKMEMITLKQAFEKYLDECVTDEQVQRILAPSIERIRAGEFDSPIQEKMSNIH